MDLQETPATPPEDYRGDDRIGYQIAGGVLLFLGWGLGVVVNLLAHMLAGTSGIVLIWVHIDSTFGAYGWGVLGLGLFAGMMGVVLIALGRVTPRGPFVLPGYDYSKEPRP